jgi:DNA-binding PadR family transcriptional regulator
MELTNNRFIILSMLKYLGPMHIYALRKYIFQQLNIVMPNSSMVGIIAELKEHGLIIDVSRTKARSGAWKISYAITPSGVESIKQYAPFITALNKAAVLAEIFSK